MCALCHLAVIDRHVLGGAPQLIIVDKLNQKGGLLLCQSVLMNQCCRNLPLAKSQAQ